MNIAYSLRLKHIAILDVTIIAAGFVLRLFVGSAATGIPLSQWICRDDFPFGTLYGTGQTQG